MLEQDDGSYVVLEGNRRLTAVKLLADPSLASTPAYKRQFETLKERMKGPILEMPCAEVQNRDEAKHWLELRHQGEAGGRAVVRWDAEASTRFFKRPGTQGQRGVSFIDALKDAYPANQARGTTSTPCLAALDYAPPDFRRD